MDDETTSPVDGEIAPDTEVETEVAEPLLDDDGNPIEDEPEPAEEEDEIDLDDETKLKLPKSQAAKLREAMLRQADYTRKTQELAETRKAFEAQRESIQQADANEMTARADMISLDSQYQAINTEVAQKYGSWDAFHDADPFEAQKLRGRISDIERQFNHAKNYLGTVETERQSKQQQADTEYQQSIAKLYDQGTPELKAAIPDWGSTKAAKLMQDAASKFGFAKDDLAGANTPGHFLLLDAAMKWIDHQAKTKKAQTVQKQTEIMPAAKVGTAKAAIAPGKLDDRLSAEEWNRRRNAQLAKRA